MNDKPLTAEEILCFDWQSILTASGDLRPDLYVDRLRRQSDTYRTTGEEKGMRVFHFLATAIGVALNFKDAGPKEVKKMVDEFDESEIQILRTVVKTVTLPVLHACICDLVITSKFCHHTAREAVSSYLTAARQYEDFSNWTTFYYHAFRAVRIAVRMGSKSEPFKDCCDYVESLLGRSVPTEAGRCSAKFLDLIAAHELGDLEAHSRLAQQLAERFELQNNFDVARRYWDAGTRLHQKRGAADCVKITKLRSAETYIKMAELEASQGALKMLVAHWLEEGLLSLIKAQANRSRIDEIHLRLVQVQKTYQTNLAAR